MRHPFEVSRPVVEAFKRDGVWNNACELCMKVMPVSRLRETGVPGRPRIVVCRACSPRSFPVRRVVVG